MSTITPQILLRAYAAGIFPMAESAEDNALYWVEPEERGIIPLDGLKISHSLRKSVRRKLFEVKIDHDFSAVIAACAARTPDRKLDLDQHPHQGALYAASPHGLLPQRGMLAGRRSWWAGSMA